MIAVTPKARDEAVAEAAERFGVHPALLRTCATHKPAHARQWAMWKLRQRRSPEGRSVHSYPAIARAFGVHHTTVMFAVKRVNERGEACPQPGKKDVGKVSDHRNSPIADSPNRPSIAA